VNLAILVPVLARPHRVTPLLDAIEATTPGARVVFLVDDYDRPEIEAIEREQRPMRRKLTIDLAETTGANYAGKINHGVGLTSEPLIFTAADDLEPQDGWLEEAEDAMRGGAEVVGINDLIDRPRDHATHFLMTRAYAERPTIDDDPGPFFEGYSHWFCDDELIGTAKARGVYAYAPLAHVMHLHPIADRAEDDDTYRKGRERMRQDRRLFTERSRLWQ